MKKIRAAHLASPPALTLPRNHRLIALLATSATLLAVNAQSHSGHLFSDPGFMFQLACTFFMAKYAAAFYAAKHSNNRPTTSAAALVPNH